MNGKKKIAVFGVKGLPAFGGAARANENVIDILKEKYDYTIYAVGTHTDKTGDFNGFYQKVFSGYKGKRINTLIYYGKSVLHAIFFSHYDLVQVNHISSGFIVPFLRSKYKVVATARGIIPKDDNKWNKFDKLLFNISAYFFFRFSNIVISVSKPHISLFEKYTKKKIVYIPNGVHDQSEKILFKKNEGYLLFAASRIISLKGGHILLEALNLLNYTGEMVFIGNLEHTPAYKKYLYDLGSNLNIKFLGLIKEKTLLFQKIMNAQLFVFPSFNEGMSNILLEVASLKTPLIVSDIPENKAIFNDSEVLFFKTGNSKDLAEKIAWANANYSIMLDRAENAFLKVKKRYLWFDIAAQYENIYDALLKD